MRIKNNVPAMNAYRNYGTQAGSLSKNLEKLSSGYRINRSADDAAGLAISEKMRAQITGMQMAQKNVKDAISLVKVADGALTEVHSMLNRMYELAEQSANGTFDTTDRAGLQSEVDSLKKEIDRIAKTANFNGQKLLNGEISSVSPITQLTSNGNFRSVSYAQFEWSTHRSDIEDEFVNALRSSSPSFTISTESYLNSSGEVMARLLTNNANIGSFTVRPSISVNEGRTIPDRLTYTISGMGEEVGRIEVRLISDPPQPVPSSARTTFSITAGKDLALRIGPSAESENKLDVRIDNIQTRNLGVEKVDISTQDGALNELGHIQNAIDFVSIIRGRIGAVQNRLEHTFQNLAVSAENLQNAESVVRDTDVASEMMEYTKKSILLNSAQSMMAQANQQPEGVLRLLQS